MMRDEGPGFPFFLPNGMILKNTLLDYWREIHKKGRICGDFHSDYAEPSACGRLPDTGITTKRTCTPLSSMMSDFAIKPMNCPGGVLVYAVRAAFLP